MSDPIPQNKWNYRYSLGIPEIDAQHKRIFQLAYLLERAIYDEKGEDFVDDAIEGMLKYIQEHFNSEEALMGKAGFPNKRVHRDQHDSFTRRVLELRAEHEEKNKPVATKILEFLKSWITDHILKEDSEYVPFIKKNSQ